MTRGWRSTARDSVTDHALQSRTIDVIRSQSRALHDLLDAERLVMLGAMYDVGTGQVRFLDEA